MALSLIFMFLSAAICLLAPAAVAVVMIAKRRASWLVFVLGIASFVSTQLLLRIPLLYELQNTAWFNLFAITQTLLCGVLVALSAGVFEETGRYIALRFVNRELLTWENGIIFGLGHGGVEAFLLTGIHYVKLIVGTLSGSDTLSAVMTPPYYFLLGGVERILAIAVHIGCTMLVLYAVKRRNTWFFLLAVLAHGVIDATIPLFMQPGEALPVWAMEGILAVFAAMGMILTVKMKPALSGAGKGA